MTEINPRMVAPAASSLAPCMSKYRPVKIAKENSMRVWMEPNHLPSAVFIGGMGDTCEEAFDFAFVPRLEDVALIAVVARIWRRCDLGTTMSSKLTQYLTWSGH